MKKVVTFGVMLTLVTRLFAFKAKDCIFFMEENMKKRIYGIVVFLTAISLFFGSCKQPSAKAQTDKPQTGDEGKPGTTLLEEFSVKFSAGEGGSISATVGNDVKVVKDTKVTFTATPDTDKVVGKWLVNNVEQKDASSKLITSETLALTIIENVDVKVEFVAKSITPTLTEVDFTLSQDGKTITGYNGQKPKGRIKIPEGVEIIADNVFEECQELESVEFPKSLTTIGSATFFGTIKLKEVDLSNTQLKSIGKSAFCGGLGQGLEKITFPESLEEIDELAFKFTNLQEVDLSNTKLKKISLQTFLGCKKLERVILPSCLETIEKDGFSGCSTLMNINLGDTQVTSIGPTAFENTKLAEVNLSKLPATLGDEVFRGATLGTVIFPESLANGEELKKLLDEGTLKGYKGVKIVDLSKTNLTSIADETFIGGKGLEEVKFPSTLKTIGKKAFNSCQNLSILDLSTTKLETIGEEAFVESTLKTIKLPLTVKKIEPNALDTQFLMTLEFMDDSGYSGWKATDPEDSSSVVNIDDKIKELTKEEKSKKFAELLKMDMSFLTETYEYCTWTKN